MLGSLFPHEQVSLHAQGANGRGQEKTLNKSQKLLGEKGVVQVRGHQRKGLQREHGAGGRYQGGPHLERGKEAHMDTALLGWHLCKVGTPCAGPFLGGFVQSTIVQGPEGVALTSSLEFCSG